MLRNRRASRSLSGRASRSLSGRAQYGERERPGSLGMSGSHPICHTCDTIRRRKAHKADRRAGFRVPVLGFREMGRDHHA